MIISGKTVQSEGERREGGGFCDALKELTLSDLVKNDFSYDFVVVLFAFCLFVCCWFKKQNSIVMFV